MLKISDASNFRRTLAGLALIVGPLFLLAQSIITPEGSEDDTEYLENIAESTSAAEWSATLGIIGFSLVAPGIIGLVSLIRERGVVLANLAMVFAVLGLINFVALMSTGYFDVALVENLSIAQAEDVMNGAEDNLDGFIPVLAIALLGTLIGFILLGIALIRSRVTPVWVPALILLGTVALVVSEESKVTGIVASALLAGGYGGAGLTILRKSDAEWEPPGSPSARPGGADAAPQATPPAPPPTPPPRTT